MILEPFSFDRLSSIRKSSNFFSRMEEEDRLRKIDIETVQLFKGGVTVDLYNGILE
jgi:hypothetical protein